MVHPGEEPQEGGEDGANLFTAVHSGNGRDNWHNLKHGRFQLDTGEKAVSLLFRHYLTT